MADLTVNNPPTQPWFIPLPIHQLSFTCIHNSCMARISPFFTPFCLNFLKHPSIFPANPQGFAPPPGFASTTPHAAVDIYGAYRLAQSGCGFYGAGRLCFVGPYGYLYLPPIQLQLKVNGRLQSGTSMEQHNRIPPSRPRIVELESRGTGVFHPPDINHGPRNKKRRRKRGKRNEMNGRVEEIGEGSTRWREEEERHQSQADYDVLLPSEWPY